LFKYEVGTVFSFGLSLLVDDLFGAFGGKFFIEAGLLLLRVALGF